MQVNGQLHAPAALLPQNSLQFLLNNSMGGNRNSSGRRQRRYIPHPYRESNHDPLGFATRSLVTVLIGLCHPHKLHFDSLSPTALHV
jgi:hypothetical protein